jgi:hypothetical protein
MKANTVVALKTLPRFRVRVNPASGAPVAARGKKKAGHNPGEIVRASLARINAAGGKVKKMSASSNPKKGKKKKKGGGVVAQIQRLLAARRNPANRTGKSHRPAGSKNPAKAKAKNVVSIAQLKHILASRKKQAETGRNPIFGRSGVTSMFYLAGLAIGGAVAARVITQAVLGTRNEGVLGYVGNLASAIGLGMASGAVLGAKTTLWVTFGGILGLTLRLLQDLTPFGAQLSLSGMGDYVVTTFFQPVNIMPGTPAQARLPRQLQELRYVPPMVAAAAGMAGRRRGVGCYNSTMPAYAHAA